VYLQLQTVSLFLRDLSAQRLLLLHQTLQTQRAPIQLQLLASRLELENNKHTNTHAVIHSLGERSCSTTAEPGLPQPFFKRHSSRNGDTCEPLGTVP